jgi:hypothetical protein
MVVPRGRYHARHDQGALICSTEMQVRHRRVETK